MSRPEPLTIIEDIVRDSLLVANDWWPGCIWVANSLLSKAYAGQLRDTTYRNDLLTFDFLSGQATYKKIRDDDVRTYENFIRDRTAFEFIRGNRDIV
jgi:hypothetical protein